ncbi:MAG: hypothetical protein IJM83_00520 [Firmicutes bacterium]|nr:hypothetical protein [Bacillota bacterium]
MLTCWTKGRDLKTDAEIWFVCATEVTCQKEDDLGHFLRYMRSMVPSNAFTEEVQRAVEAVSRDAEWRKEMYTWEMKIQREREAAAKEAAEKVKKEMIFNMKENGLPNEQIAAIVKLPIEVVVQLENEPLHPNKD